MGAYGQKVRAREVRIGHGGHSKKLWARGGTTGPLAGRLTVPTATTGPPLVPSTEGSNYALEEHSGAGNCRSVATCHFGGQRRADRVQPLPGADKRLYLLGHQHGAL